MKRVLAVLAAVAVCPPLLAAEPETEMDISMGGCGGVYFLAEAGELVVDVQKRDRNVRGRHTDLRAILVGPDRRVLRDVTIPDDGRPRGSGLGPVQSVRLAARVERKGVYGLNITVSQDRYGEEILWGFRTNCPRYLIETSRGHKDERHQEPIVLAGSDRPVDVCFVPREGPLAMEVTGLPDGVAELTVFGRDGAVLATLPVEGGRASHTFAAEVPRDAALWRLHLPVQQATVQIDGVTRWASDSPYPNLSLWTNEPAAHFPFRPYRWLLAPYSRLVYGQADDEGEVSFEVHNNAPGKRTVVLEVEFSGDPWPVELSDARLTLGSKQSRRVTLRYTVPPEGQTRVCHLRVTPAEDPDFSTYSTLTVKAGTAPAAGPIDVPLVLKPYEHENEQFGYLPDYPRDSHMYFDPENRPWVRTASGIERWRDGRWVTTDFGTAVRLPDGSPASRSFGMSSTKVAFDRDGGAYVLGRSGAEYFLLHSADGGETFTAHRIPCGKAGGRALDLEQFSGHNAPEGPPPILRYTHTASDPNVFWRRIHDLELILPEKGEAGDISFGTPVPITKSCIGLAAHSGIPSGVVSREGKVHVVWAEATDPADKAPGVPTFVATYDRAGGKLGEPALVGYGPPANDIHNSPSITMDSRGYLHVLAGTHGRPFPFARSLAPNDAGGGWTEAEVTGAGNRQTYIGLVCGPDDALHAAFRLWRSGVEPFPASHYGTLACQRKRPDGPWEPPRVLVVPPFSEYSVYYHRLTIDRRGRLFLSYDHWSTYWFYRNDHRGHRRAVLMSPDGGETWKLAGAEDFRP